MARTTFKLNGLKNLQDKIAQLPRELHDKAAARATAKAADHLRNEVKKNVPLAKQGSYAAMFRGAKITRQRGDLAKALIIKRLSQAEQGDFAAKHKVVFWRNDQTQGIGYIAHFLENGTKAHDIPQPKLNRTIKHKGTTGTKFFSQTLKRERKNMNKIMEQEILKAIAEHFRR